MSEENHDMNFNVKVQALGIDPTLQQVDKLVEEFGALEEVTQRIAGLKTLERYLKTLQTWAKSTGKEIVDLADAIHYVADERDRFETQKSTNDLANRYGRAREEAERLGSELRALIKLQKEFSEGAAVPKNLTPGAAQALQSRQDTRYIQGAGLIQKLSNDPAVSGAVSRATQLGKSLDAELANNVKSANNVAHALDLVADARYAQGLKAEGEAARQGAADFREYASSLQLAAESSNPARSVAAVRLPSTLAQSRGNLGPLVNSNVRVDSASADTTHALGLLNERMQAMGKNALQVAQDEGVLTKAQGEAAHAATLAAQANDRLAAHKEVNGLKDEAQQLRENARLYREYADAILAGDAAAAFPSGATQLAGSKNAAAIAAASTAYKPGLTTQAESEAQALAGVTQAFRNEAKAADEATIAGQNSGKQIAGALRETLGVARQAEKALGELAGIRDQEGLTAYATKIRGLEAEMTRYIEQVQAAAKAGDLLGAANVPRPQLLGGGLVNVNLTRSIAKATQGIGDDWVKAGISVEKFTEALHVALAETYRVIAADEASTEALQAKTRQQAILNQYMYDENKAASGKLGSALGGTLATAKQAQAALGNLAGIREQEGLTAYAAKLRGLEAEMARYIEQVDAAVKAGDILGASQVQRPQLIGGNLVNANLSRAIAKATAEVDGEWAKAGVSVDKFTQALQTALAETNRIIAADERATEALREKTQNQAILNQYLYDENKAASNKVGTKLSETIATAKEAKAALGNLAGIREEEGLTAYAAKLRELETEMGRYIEQVDAAVKAGDILGASKIQPPTLIGGSAVNEDLARRIAKAASEVDGEWAKAGASVDKLTQGLQAALTETNRIIKADEESVAILEKKTQNQAILNQYLYDEAKAAQQAQRARFETLANNSGAGQQLGNFYPLIVSAGLWTALSHSMLGVSGAAIKTSADYEKAFADVARTTNVTTGNVEGKLAALKQQLIDLSSQVPVGFTDLAKVATLGNQLGIASGDITDFTKNVAQFSAVTGVTTEETAKSFGSLSQVLHLSQRQYKDLGSAITYVGRKSIATEAEVLTMANRIGSTATQAGFTKEQIVGLSGALASLREAPERSQGALEQFFKTINKAASDGGQKLENFGRVTGLTGAKVKELLNSGKKGDSFTVFRAFLQGIENIKKSDGITAQLKALDALGIKNVRVSEVVRRLADNLGYVDKTQADAAAGFKNGTDLADQYATKTATLAAQFQILQNNVANLFNQLGNTTFTTSLTSIVTLLGLIVKGVTDWLGKNKDVATWVIAITGVIGAFALLKAVTVGATLATYALDVAQARVGASGFFGSIGKMIGLMTGFSGAAGLATRSMVAQGIAARGAGGELLFTGATARKVAGALAELGIVSGGSDAAMVRLGEAGAIAGVGMTKASTGAMLLARALVAKGIVADEAAGLQVLAAAGVATGAGMEVAATGTTLFARAVDVAKLSVRLFADTFVIPILIFALIDLITDWQGSMLRIAGILGWFSDWVLAPLGEAINWLARTTVGAVANMEDAFANMIGFLAPWLSASVNAYRKGAAALRGMANDMTESYDQINKNLHGSIQGFVDYANSIQDKNKAQTGSTKIDQSAADILKQMQDALSGVNTELPVATDNTNKNAAATKAAAREVRTFADYANDLNSVMSRALDIQFGPQIGFDGVLNAFDDMKKGADDARKAIRDAKNEIAGINAEIAKLQADNRQQAYFKAVAGAFGDAAGAAAIQATIDKNNADIAAKQASKADQNQTISDNQQKLDRTTTGNSKAARDNRAALYDLVQKYQDYITKLAASGISQKELNKKVGEARSRFVDQGTALGYSLRQLQPYSQALVGFRKIVDTLPRNVTVSVDARFPASSALSEFFARQRKEAADTAASIKGSLSGVGDFPTFSGPAVQPSKGAREEALIGKITAYSAWLSTHPKSQIAEQRDIIVTKLSQWQDDLFNGRYYTGGFTGPGGKYEPAGIVHKGEYVVPKQYVNQTTGLPYADFLGKLVKGTQGTMSYANGGFVDAGAGMMELGPQTMKVLTKHLDRAVEARINAGDIAGSTSAYNANNRRRGQG